MTPTVPLFVGSPAQPDIIITCSRMIDYSRPGTGHGDSRGRPAVPIPRVKMDVGAV